MPSASMNQVPVNVELDGYEGRMLAWGDFTMAFERIPKGDQTALLRGLPDDSCRCPHYGFLFKGRMTVRYRDHEETISAGEAYYLPPGHVPIYEEDCEALEFSPTGDRAPRVEAVERDLQRPG